MALLSIRNACLLAIVAGIQLGCSATQSTDGQQGRADSNLDRPKDAVPETSGDTDDDPYGSLLAQGPGGSGAVADWERERDQQLKTRREISKHYESVGRKLFDESKFREAERNLEWAVDADPTNISGQQMLDLVRWMLEERDGEIRFASEAFVQEKLVLIDMKKVEVQRYFDLGMQSFNDGDYTRAVENFERVIEIIQWFPYEIDTENAGYRQRSEQLLAESRKKQRLSEIERRIARERSAYSDALNEEAEVQRQRERQIRTLIERCTDLLGRKKFVKAEEVALEILENYDNKHPLALKLRQLAIDGRHLDVSETTFNLKNRNYRESEAVWEEVEIPFHDPIVWPSKDAWNEMRALRKTGISDELEEPEWIVEAKKKLNLLTINGRDLNGKTLGDVIGDFRRYTDLNFIVHKDVDLEREISLGVPEITIGNALKIILKEAGYEMDFSDDAIMIIPKEELKPKTFLEIYPVDDLLTKITNFTAPDLSVQDPAAQAAGGAGGGFSPFAGFGGDDDDDDAEPLDAEKLVDLIKAQTGEDAWGEENTNIEEHRGQLLVRNSREVHQIVREVLEQLRANTGIYVVVEARFIDITDQFLQDIGIDFRGLGQGNPAFGSNFNLARQNTTFFDVGFTRSNPQPGLGSGPNPGPGPGNQNFAGRMQNIVDRFPNGVSIGDDLVGGGGATLATTLLEPFQISAILRAERATRFARVVDSPTVVAQDRQRVYVAVVTQQAYVSDYDVSAQSFGNSAIEIADPVIRTFEQGVSLEVKPTVSSDRRYVHLDLRPTLARGVLQDINIPSLGTIDPNVPAASNVNVQVPIIDLQQAWTSVTIPDGGTAMLGGFRLKKEYEDTASIPFLSNIPILDLLFKRETISKENQSLIIMVTARIVVIRDEEKKRFNDD